MPGPTPRSAHQRAAEKRASVYMPVGNLPCRTPGVACEPRPALRRTRSAAGWFGAAAGIALGSLAPLPALGQALGQAPPSRFISEVKIGALVHDVPYMWSGFNKEPYAVDLNVEILFSPLATFWGGTISPALGATINFNGDTSRIYLDARWQKECENNLFYAFGLGLALHNGETFSFDSEAKQLGRRVLFHPNAEVGYRLDPHQSVSIYFEHISNASTASKNQGMDTLGVRYGFRF